MTLPTSAPREPFNKERRLKLRASCDACAASKVKCDKQHPECGRCSTNGSRCHYGVSRKHGKPGRKKKWNADGTPFIRAPKRPSPNGEFGKFRIRPEPTPKPRRDTPETTLTLSSNWSPTPSLPETPAFEFGMTPEPPYIEPGEVPFMGFTTNSSFDPDLMSAYAPEKNLRESLAKKQSIQLDVPEVQNIGNYSDSMNPMAYTYQDTSNHPYFSTSACPNSSPQSMRNQSTHNFSPGRCSVSMPLSHCCYTEAYSTLESLRIAGTNAPQAYPSTENMPLDSVLGITRLAVQSMSHMLACPCASDPHLAMLFGSITSKILTWYQIAAGVKTATLATRPGYSNSGFNSPGSSGRSSALSSAVSEHERAFSTASQQLQPNLFQCSEMEQARLRREAILTEMKACEQLVNAFVDWTGDEQTKFLYNFLGTWLSPELLKTFRQVENA